MFAICTHTVSSTDVGGVEDFEELVAIEMVGSP